jgi:large subunit ribosomal protein L19
MPTEKKGDNSQDVEQKQISEPSIGENQNQKKSDKSKSGGDTKSDIRMKADQDLSGKSEAKEEIKSDKEKEDKVVEKEDVQPEKEGKKPGIGELDYYSEVRTDIPEIKPGDILRVSYRVIEGGKERIQVFEGTVIALKNSGISKTITVRKTSFGISVERIFPLNSKLIQKIQIKKHSKVRRAKLYYLRKLKGKAARLKELR